MTAECLIRYDEIDYKVEIEHLHHQLFFRWPGKLHSHPSYHLILISQGDCHVQFANKAPIFLDQKDLLFINPDVPHLFIPNAETGVEHTSCIWRFRDREGKYALFPLQALSGDRDGRDFIIRHLTDLEASSFQRLHRLAENYYNESRGEFKAASPVLDSRFERNDAGSFFDASCNVFKLWLTGYGLVMDINAKIPKLQTDSKLALVEKIHKLIEMNFSLTNFSVNYLAQVLHMHPNYLNNIFSRETGSSIGRLIRTYRLEYAKDLLLRTTLSIADIAARSGFSRHNYFARIFRTATGTTPHEFRKKPPENQEFL